MKIYRHTSPNNWIQRLSGNAQKVGTGMVLKVMAGDKVNIHANSWYRLNGANPGSPVNLQVADLLSSLVGGIAGASSGGHAATQLQSNGNLSSGVGRFLTESNSNYAANGNKPKAYLNYVLFDEQFNIVWTGDGRNSGLSQVGNNEVFTSHDVVGREMKKSGYLYIYVSNETPNIDVFFDNLQVTHERGALTEETHYYAFGLTMAGISSRAAGKMQNRLRYNGKELQNWEFSDGSGLELYDYGARMQDPQVGNWWTIDPMSDSSHRGISPYVHVYGNPVLYSDHEGEFGIAGALVGGFIGAAASLTKSVIQGGFESLNKKETWFKAGVNAAAGAIVGATGGIAALSTAGTTALGMAATAVTSFGTSIAENKIDGKEIDYGGAVTSSLFATATFGIFKYGTSKITSSVTSNWWNRGNTNAVTRYLGKAPSTNVGQVMDRVGDISGLGIALVQDKLMQDKKITTAANINFVWLYNATQGGRGNVIVHPLGPGEFLW